MLEAGLFFFTSDHSARVHVGHNIEFRLWKLRPIITTFPISFTFKGLFPIGLPTELCQNENHLLQPQEMTTALILSLARLPILTHCSTSSCPYITSLVSLIMNLWEAPQNILQTTSLLGVTKQCEIRPRWTLFLWGWEWGAVLVDLRIGPRPLGPSLNLGSIIYFVWVVKYLRFLYSHLQN